MGNEGSSENDEPRRQKEKYELPAGQRRIHDNDAKAHSSGSPRMT